jgi:hypothetical protein
MIPKLTDEAISLLPLQSGRAELLEEIMTTVAPDRQTETVSNPAPRRTRWLAPLAAAAVVAGLAGGTMWWQDQHPEKQPELSASAALGLAEGQQVVLDAPGWDVDSMGDGIRFRNGAADLEITTYAAKDYDSYVKDREHIVDPPAPGEPVQVLGRPAQMWAYGATDHTAIREVQNGRWMEIRAGGVDRDGYLALLGDLRVVTSAEYEAALPDDFVTTAERPEAAQKIIGEIQAVSGAGFPDGASLQLGEGESQDSYQFGAEVAGAYACAWLEAFGDAQAHDQQGLADEAARVLGTSRQWPVLKEMNADGDYPEVVWEYADRVVTGEAPDSKSSDGAVTDGYREALGCR